MQLNIFDDGSETGCPLPEVSPNYRLERNLARGAEYLVAFDISRRGFDCFTVGEGLRYDLIADIGGIRRVQVKMNRRAVFRGSNSITRSYTFGSDHNLLSYLGDVDLFAFVAIDRQTVLYSAPDALKRSNLHVSESIMTPEGSDLSWVDATRGWIE